MLEDIEELEERMPPTPVKRAKVPFSPKAADAKKFNQFIDSKIEEAPAPPKLSTAKPLELSPLGRDGQLRPLNPNAKLPFDPALPMNKVGVLPPLPGTNPSGLQKNKTILPSLGEPTGNRALGVKPAPKLPTHTITGQTGLPPVGGAVLVDKDA
jgi:hypothetical protein